MANSTNSNNLDNMTLEEEADKANGYLVYSFKIPGTKAFAFHEGFISGVKSKYVKKKILKTLIDDLDYRLSVIEDYAKGEAGVEITKLRKYIQETYES